MALGGEPRTDDLTKCVRIPPRISCGRTLYCGMRHSHGAVRFRTLVCRSPSSAGFVRPTPRARCSRPPRPVGRVPGRFGCGHVAGDGALPDKHVERCIVGAMMAGDGDAIVERPGESHGRAHGKSDLACGLLLPSRGGASRMLWFVMQAARTARLSPARLT